MQKLGKIKNIFIFIIRNKYLVTLIAFILWVVFFDTNSLIDRYSSLNKLNSLKKEHSFFLGEFQMYKNQYHDLFSGKYELEKFAREQYLMKADNEDIYIINFVK